MNKKLSLLTVAALVIVSVFAGMEINQLISGDNLYDQVNKFREVLGLTEKYYLEPVDPAKLTDAAVTGLLDKLDPHSTYIPPRALVSVTEEFRGEFEGIGIRFTVRNDSIFVVETIGGGPSARLGIQTNDRIVRINDSSAVGLTNDQVIQRLRGPKGTRVGVSIARPGVKDLLDFEIVRDKIALTSVDVAMMVTDEIGYISVNRFSEKTNVEMDQALRSLKAQGMKRLILDLRDNPGGLLEQAFKMVDLFLDGGTTDAPHKIVYTKSRRPEFDEVYYARTGQAYEHLPLIILINNNSASASEIVAGAIQDWDRGLIVGETSFGKGLVQRQFQLDDGSALRLTIARYYTPSGRSIQREYEGKERAEYQREAFTRQEREGENIEHTEERDTTRPMYRTHDGRVVYGGGGITPDYVIKNAPLTPFTRALLRRGLFDQFVTAYLDGKGLSIRSAYGKNREAFEQSFKVTEDLLKDFRSYITQRDVTINQEDYDKDVGFFRVRLKATLARSFWGNEGWYPLMLQIDPPFRKALSLFPEAEKIAGLN